MLEQRMSLYWRRTVAHGEQIQASDVAAMRPHVEGAFEPHEAEALIGKYAIIGGSKEGQPVFRESGRQIEWLLEQRKARSA